MRVLVVLSTYNGERYLRDQLDSILNQKGIDLSLLVRDDGSIDNTCNILKEYADLYPNIQWTSSENVGFVKSFSKLLRKAFNSDFQADYYAFADQDDIWMPNKMRIACDVLSECDQSLPLLYSCNSNFINSDGQDIGLFHKGCPIFRKGNCLMYGTEQGCSMVFNSKAVELYLNNTPQLTWHDRWMYYICMFLGITKYDNNPRFQYRIHDNNALGKSEISSNRGTFKKAEELLHFYFNGKASYVHIGMAKEFLFSFNSLLKPEDKKILKRYITYQSIISSKLYLLLNPQFKCPYNNFTARFSLILNILLNKV